MILIFFWFFFIFFALNWNTSNVCQLICKIDVRNSIESLCFFLLNFWKKMAHLVVCMKCLSKNFDWIIKCIYARSYDSKTSERKKWWCFEMCAEWSNQWLLAASFSFKFCCFVYLLKIFYTKFMKFTLRKNRIAIG